MDIRAASPTPTATGIKALDGASGICGIFGMYLNGCTFTDMSTQYVIRRAKDI